MPPRPAPTAAQAAHMQAIAQISNSLTPEQRAALQAHLARAAQTGANGQTALQDWLKQNAASLQANRIQHVQQQMAAQQQQRTAGGVVQGNAAQGILTHLFPPNLANNVQAGVQHLMQQLFIADNQGGFTPSPILQQVGAMANKGFMSQQQLHIFKLVVSRGTANQQQRQGAASSPPYQQPQGANPAIQRAQAASSPPAGPGAAAGTSTPDRQGTPQQQQIDPRHAVQALKSRLQQIDALLARTDLSADDRAKALQQQQLARNQLQIVVARLQQQEAARQGTPNQHSNQQFAQAGTSQGAQAALGFQQNRNGTPQPGAQAGANQAQRIVNPAQLSNNQPNLAFGGAQPQPGSIAPNATTIAPNALNQTPAATRVGTPNAPTMTATPSGGNLSVSTPAASGSTAVPAPVVPQPTARQSTDPRPDAGGRMVTKRKLRDLLAGIDDGDRLADPAEDLLQDVADEFVKSVCAFACRLAKHRGSERLEVRDIAFHLDRTYSMKIPGFSTDADAARQVPPGPRRGNNPTPYQTRLNAIAASEAAAKRAAR